MNLRRAYKLGFIQGLAEGVSSADDLSELLRSVPEEVSLSEPTQKDAPLPPGTGDTGRFYNEFHRVGTNQGHYLLDQALPPDTAI